MKLQFHKFWVILLERQDQMDGSVSGEKKKGWLNLRKSSSGVWKLVVLYLIRG